MKMRLLIIAAVFLQSSMAFFGLSIRPKFTTNLILFDDVVLEANETEVYTISTEMNDYDVSNTDHIPDVMNTEILIEEIITETISEEPSETADAIEMVHIQLTPEEYKEYYVAVRDRRQRIFDETDGERYV